MKPGLWHENWYFVEETALYKSLNLRYTLYKTYINNLSLKDNKKFEWNYFKNCVRASTDKFTKPAFLEKLYRIIFLLFVCF